MKFAALFVIELLCYGVAWRMFSEDSVMNLHRRQFLSFAVRTTALFGVVGGASARDYPTGPVRLIVPYPSGISPDIIARLAGQALSEQISQSVVIENKPGAAGNIGTEFVARATPDGYTLLLLAPTNAINQSLYKHLNFDFTRDIVPIASINSSPFVMVVNPSVDAKTIPEFISYAKARAGNVNMASGGIGTPPHVCGELFKMMTGIDMVHVPYRGNYTPDLLSGVVQVAFPPIASVIGYIRAGKLRGLGVTTSTRSAELPDVPAIGEFVQGYEASGWLGIGAPKGISSDVVDTLNKEINRVLAEPKLKARLVELGVFPMSMTPSEFRKLIADDTDKWAKVVKFAHITAD
jgi:tripartite-type tricarboxylate transporter receptor subunit TctC